MTLSASDLTRVVEERVLYEGVHFTLQQGQTIAIRGPSGAGKSQLLRQLSGLDGERDGWRRSGVVTLDGQDQEQFDPQEWRARVCHVPQRAPRLDGTPAEFLERLQTFRVQRTRESLDARKLGTQLGLDASHWTRLWEDLSIGERQRALLAALLSRKPQVLLLDEPTAALDPDSVTAVETLLASETCVWVTHSPKQAKRVADKSLILPGGTDAD